MQVPGEEDLARNEALKRRTEAHARWKANFFKSRPPPQFIPKPRRRRGPIANAPVHSLFKRAKELVAAATAAAGESLSSLQIPPISNEVEETLSKKAEWERQMRKEMNQRDPYTDIKICSDPRRTVVMSSLHTKATEEDIRLFGEEFGQVLGVRLICDTKGKSRRYAFVEFALEAVARRAVVNSRKHRLLGRPVVIDMERGRVDPSFLPKRIAEAQRQSGVYTTTNNNNNFSCDGSINLINGAESSSSVPVSLGVKRQRGELSDNFTSTKVMTDNSRDEVDALLDDIMNLA